MWVDIIVHLTVRVHLYVFLARDSALLATPTTRSIQNFSGNKYYCENSENLTQAKISTFTVYCIVQCMYSKVYRKSAFFSFLTGVRGCACLFGWRLDWIQLYFWYIVATDGFGADVSFTSISSPRSVLQALARVCTYRQLVSQSAPQVNSRCVSLENGDAVQCKRRLSSVRESCVLHPLYQILHVVDISVCSVWSNLLQGLLLKLLKTKRWSHSFSMCLWYLSYQGIQLLASQSRVATHSLRRRPCFSTVQ